MAGLGSKSMGSAEGARGRGQNDAVIAPRRRPPTSGAPELHAAWRFVSSDGSTPQRALRVESATRNAFDALSGTPHRGRCDLDPLSRPLMTRIALSAAAALWLSACSVLAPSRLRSPVEPFARPETEPDAIACAMRQRHPPLQTLKAKADIVARGRVLKGKGWFTLLVLYRSEPRAVVLRAERHPAGEFFRLVQKGGETTIFLKQRNAAFRGKAAELANDRRLLLGLTPSDVVRAFLVGQEAAALVSDSPSGLRRPGLFRKRQTFRAPLSRNGQIVLQIRRADGLVCRMDLYAPNGKRKMRAIYKAYERVGEALFPTRFDLCFAGRRLRFEVEARQGEVYPDFPLSDRNFPLDPPGDVEPRPLGELLRDFAQD